ncbi:MAG: dephospho-CoA kinase, partial [Caldisericum exile]
MKVIGLTGNIASGKSSVSNILKDLGAKIIDMDNIAKEIQ